MVNKRTVTVKTWCKNFGINEKFAIVLGMEVNKKKNSSNSDQIRSIIKRALTSQAKWEDKVREYDIQILVLIDFVDFED